MVKEALGIFCYLTTDWSYHLYPRINQHRINIFGL